ncbi:hypothetical protein A6X21_13070 [Planctopirus hydrillae]|uniref:Uncharacterized protein n=1 Tax=Planctopirus hydrillae TaxID=1841610 RepID=A0A1C3E5Y2_9PLAN|nr:hypothetical protein A6X21_13070 [Planctopirus hydrillae]
MRTPLQYNVSHTLRWHNPPSHKDQTSVEGRGSCLRGWGQMYSPAPSPSAQPAQMHPHMFSSAESMFAINSIQHTSNVV